MSLLQKGSSWYREHFYRPQTADRAGINWPDERRSGHQYRLTLKETEWNARELSHKKKHNSRLDRSRQRILGAWTGIVGPWTGTGDCGPLSSQKTPILSDGHRHHFAGGDGGAGRIHYGWRLHQRHLGLISWILYWWNCWGNRQYDRNSRAWLSGSLIQFK